MMSQIVKNVIIVKQYVQNVVIQIILLKLVFVRVPAQMVDLTFLIPLICHYF